MKIIRTIKSMSDITIPRGMTRKCRYIVIHCTSAPQNQSTQEMFNYWIRVNKWTTPGYHYEIDANGVIEQFQEIDVPSNGVKGYNAEAIHVSYKGGIDYKGRAVDNRTEFQKKSQYLIIDRLKYLFPNAAVLGHRDFSTDANGNGILESWEWIKSCPSYDVRDDLAKRGHTGLITPSKIVYKLNYPLIKNETVKAIQIALKLKADGYFGADTDKAVKEFQAKNGLAVDGVVGSATAKLLGVTI